MNKIKWIIFAAIAVGALALLVVFSGGSSLDVKDVDTNAIQDANKQNGNIAEHVYGNPNSPVTLVNYGDFQCPACATTHPRIKAIVEQYKDKIRFVFRNFPLTTIHPNAKAAAATAEAAGLQGKYWEMHDKLYENQTAWASLSGTERTTFFENYARELNLDMGEFSTDVASESVRDKIAYDTAISKKINVIGTPTFYLNGTKLDQSIVADITKLTGAINDELAKNGIALP
ncbi:MAG: thioredoxin domain-containing protein [Candidatus Saccharibacteria bacterium]